MATGVGEGDSWLGFSCVCELEGVTSDVLPVPLTGIPTVMTEP